MKGTDVVTFADGPLFSDICRNKLKRLPPP